MRSTLGTWCVAAMTLAAIGCGASHEEAVCLEYVDHIAKAFERCQPGMYQVVHDSIMKEIGSCGRIVEIRDEVALRAKCFPFIDSVQCSQIRDPNISFEAIVPASCKTQLLY